MHRFSKQILAHLSWTILFTLNTKAQSIPPDPLFLPKTINYYGCPIKPVHESSGIVYRVTTDKQFIEAYRGQRCIWRTNAVSVCGDGIIGEPVIRSLEIEGKHLIAVVGKHAYVRIDKRTGKACFWAAD